MVKCSMVAASPRLLACCVCFALLIGTAGCPEGTRSGTLTGTVSTEADGPVKGATITTVPPTSQAVTDSLGAFRLDFVPADTYLVRAVCPGFLPDSGALFVAPDDTAHIHLTLRTARRRVAAEMIATVCVCSRPERAAMYALMDSVGDSLCYVEYHATSDTLAEYWEPLLCPASEQRRLLYCPVFTLGGWVYFDGVTEQKTTGRYRQLFDSLARVASTVAVSLTAGRSGDSAVTTTVELRAVEDIGPNVGVGVGLYELGLIPFENAPGDTSWFRNVVLDLRFADTVAMSAGEVRTITRTLVIPDTLSPRFPPFHVVNKARVGAYAVVQHLVTRQVLQAAQAMP